MSEHGAVIGKFLPPHRGHHNLIESALAQVDRLTVIVCERFTDEIPGAQRVAWLRELHPGAEVMLVEDRYPPDDSALWARLTRRWLGRAPDVVFTSEAYGDAYARHLGCRHVAVDPDRKRFPCSGSAIRADPFGRWDCLEACVRAYLVLRVVVLGAESSGTTTLARALAAHYDTEVVSEYGRDYWVEKQARGEGRWTSDEFVHIAERQAAWEDEAARRANRILIADTDPFATCLWHERYVGSWSPEVERVSAGRRVDLYLLTDIDIPFVQDGTRDGEHVRAWMHDRFRAALERRGVPWLTVSGSHAQRMATAADAIDRQVTRGTWWRRPAFAQIR